MMKKQYENTINLWAETLARSRQGNMEDNKAIMAYALNVAIFNALVIMVTVLVSIVLGVFPTVASAFIANASLRIVTGGYHCANPLTCLVLTAVSMNIYGLAAVRLADVMDGQHVIILLLIIMSFSLWFIVKNAPVDTPNKPIKEERRPVLKKKGLRVWAFWAIALTLLSTVNLNDYEEFILAIGLGIANQTFSISGVLKNKN